MANLQPRTEHWPGKLFHTLGIRRRLLSALLLVSILPIIAVGIGTSVLFSAALSDQVGRYSSQLVAQIAKNINETFDRMVAVSEDLIVHPSVQAGLKNADPGNDLEKHDFLKKMDEDLSRITFRDGKVTDANIFRLDNSLLFNTGYTLYRDIDLTQIQSGIFLSKQNMYWTVVSNIRGTPLIVVGRRVYDVLNTQQSIGYLVLMLDEQTFARNTFYGIEMNADSRLSLITRDGIVIATAKGGLQSGARFSDAKLLSKLDQIEDELPNSFVWTGGGQSCLVCATSIPQTDWLLVAQIPNRFADSLSWQLSVGVVLLCLVVLGLVSFVVYSHFRATGGIE